jgi:hypothetical protein
MSEASASFAGKPVDLMVGMYAERRPQGFAFSASAFRIFRSDCLASSQQLTASSPPTTRGLHPGRSRLDRVQHHVQRPASPLSGARPGLAVGRERLPLLAASGRLSRRGECGKLRGEGPLGEECSGGPEHLRGALGRPGQQLAQLLAEAIGATSHAGTPTGLRGTGRSAGVRGAMSCPESWTRHR